MLGEIPFLVFLVASVDRHFTPAPWVWPVVVGLGLLVAEFKAWRALERMVILPAPGTDQPVTREELERRLDEQRIEILSEIQGGQIQVRQAERPDPRSESPTVVSQQSTLTIPARQEVLKSVSSSTEVALEADQREVARFPPRCPEAE